MKSFKEHLFESTEDKDVLSHEQAKEALNIIHRHIVDKVGPHKVGRYNDKRSNHNRVKYDGFDTRVPVRWDRDSERVGKPVYNEPEHEELWHKAHEELKKKNIPHEFYPHYNFGYGMHRIILRVPHKTKLERIKNV